MNVIPIFFLHHVFLVPLFRVAAARQGGAAAHVLGHAEGSVLLETRTEAALRSPTWQRAVGVPRRIGAPGWFRNPAFLLPARLCALATPHG